MVSKLAKILDDARSGETYKRESDALRESDILIRLRNCLTPGHPYGANGADKVLRDAVEWIEKLEIENLELRHDLERLAQ